MVIRGKEFLGNDDLIFTFMGERFYLSNIHFAVKVYALGFLSENDRHMEMHCRNTGDTDTGCLDGQDLVDIFIGKTALELRAHLVKKFDIHLMV